MSTQLAVYENVANPIEAVERYGEMIASSQLFGCKNKAQGQTLVLMAMCEGLPITEMRKRYHIVNGSELSMRADYMRAEFRRLGGKYSWINQGDDGEEAVLRVIYADNDIEVKFTIQDAERQGLVKKGSGWTKDPGAMLRARVSTKAIRMVCPEVLAGFPSDEELDATTENEGDRLPRGRAEQLAEMASESSPSTAAQPAEEPVEDAQFEPVPEKNVASGEQISRITELFKTLGTPGDKQLDAIKRRDATSMADLSPSGADDLIAALEKRLDQQANQTAGESKASGEATSEPANGPCDEQQIERMKSLMKQLSQAPGHAETSGKIKAHLEKHGLSKLSDLSHEEANKFIHFLTTKNVEAFFEMSLAGAAAKNQ